MSYPNEKMKILISGGSGLLGRKLSIRLQLAGHEVAWLGRSFPKDLPDGIRHFFWQPEKEKIDEAGVEWAEGLVNLAGASIGETRWNKQGRQLILESRLSSVRTLTRAFSKRGPLQSFTGISGAGFYGAGNRRFTEADGPGNDFPARVAARWEEAYEEFRQNCQPGHFSILRMGVVLSAAGGALPEILKPFRAGIGSELGNGRQAFNWIHENDASGLLAESLNWNGIFNASAPAEDTNASLSRLLNNILGKPAFLPAVPAFVLKLMLGERSALVLQGNFSNVSKVQNLGYQFEFPYLEDALRDLLKTEFR